MRLPASRTLSGAIWIQIVRRTYDEAVYRPTPGVTSRAAIALVFLTALSGCASTITSPAVSPKASNRRPSISVIPDPTGVALPIVAGSAKSGTSLPWSLIRVDHADNRIYLSVSGPGNLCTTPTGVQVDETAQTVTIRAVGRSTDGPCTAQKITIIGYVAPKTPIGARLIEHADAH